MEIVGLILGILGLFGGSAVVWFFGTYLRHFLYSRFGSKDRVRAEVERIASRRSYRFGATEAGTFSSVRIRFFVDFLAASNDTKESHQLDRWMTRWIWLNNLRPTRIAVPKLGNVVFASIVARRLRLPLVVVYQQLAGGLHSRLFDGEVNAGDQVLVIDDVASDASFLCQIIDKLVAANGTVLGLAVLVNRTEGSCAAAARDKGVGFYPILELEDQRIAELLGVPLPPLQPSIGLESSVAGGSNSRTEGSALS